jgi:hypothetical protein
VENQERSSHVAVVAVALVALLVLPFAGAFLPGENGLLWLGAGALVWGLSVEIKFLLADLWEIAAGERLPHAMRAAVHGLLSAACELGAAAAALKWVLPMGTAWHATAFGVGAGQVESCVLFSVGFWQAASTAPAQTDVPGASSSAVVPWHVRGTFVVERASALLGHVGSRGLVWLGLHAMPWTFALALATFALVDGVATHGSFRRWNWLAFPTWWRFYAFTLAVGLVELAVFASLAFR